MHKKLLRELRKDLDRSKHTHPRRYRRAERDLARIEMRFHPHITPALKKRRGF
ncbi:MAG: hypothetical protein KGH64_00750 [Candidatus Micrarchaeota archaeon]|nr:hypothetical protein [Candidatus Micrarchaeota archaeon]